jgi:hypothetical protein
MGAELATCVLVEVAESSAIVVPDHNCEILARIWLVEVDERRLALAVGGVVNAGDLTANSSCLSDMGGSLGSWHIIRAECLYSA